MIREGMRERGIGEDTREASANSQQRFPRSCISPLIGLDLGRLLPDGLCCAADLSLGVWSYWRSVHGCFKVCLGGLIYRDNQEIISWRLPAM